MAYTDIDKPTDYFNTKLYTGNGASSHAITGVGFQPDFTWIKDRVEVYDHHLFDSVRGGGNSLYSNDTVAENTYTTDISFDSDGFTTAGVGAGAINYINQNGHTFASWNWLAGGTASSNTDGSITSSVSANTTAGFSIVSYTGTVSAGATIGHGLGVAPSMIITKNRSLTGGAGNWVVYHKSLGNTKFLLLNLTNAEGSSSGAWNNTTPTSSVFTVGHFESTNGDEPMIAYCFAEKKGFSKFGSYTGNGSTDGTFVYTGFKPAFTILKRTDATGGWIVVDNKRDTFNVAGKFLYPHDNGAEQDLTSSHTPLDFLSNGMKMRSSNLTGTTSLNISGATYIYMAFAEEPLVGDNPATAR